MNIYYNEHLQCFGLYEEDPTDSNYKLLGNQDRNKAYSFVTFFERTFLFKKRNFEEIKKKYEVYFAL